MEQDFIPKNWERKANIITVVGAGGGGSNAVSYMFSKGIEDVDFAICNTDKQALDMSKVPVKIQLGEILTKGLGAGTDAVIGKKAAQESIEDIEKLFSSSTEMAFVTCGMGGGTGTGAAPVIAEVARKKGLLTVGVVTIPFRDEGEEALYRAVEGIKELHRNVDSILIIDNQKLYQLYDDMDVFSAFHKADEVLCTAVKSIAEIITKGGHINADFADVRKIMQNSGVSLMGIGTASGPNRVEEAVEQAICSPLLQELDLSTAKNALVNITTSSVAGEAVTMAELSKIMDLIKNRTGQTVNFKRGIVRDDSMGDSVSVTLIATGFEMTQLPVIEVKKKNIIEVKYGDSVSKNKKSGVPLYPEEESNISSKRRFEGKPSLIVSAPEEITELENEPAFYRRERLINLQKAEKEQN
ncbi:MAG: cell division protein FtsZ [Bacteroidales bacterium]|nr:cell division protein FtsZ [Bacteroidales bacterium]